MDLEKVHKWGSVGLSVRQDFGGKKNPISVVKFISDAAGFLQMRRWKMYEYNSGRRQGDSLCGIPRAQDCLCLCVEMASKIVDWK